MDPVIRQDLEELYDETFASARLKRQILHLFEYAKTLKKVEIGDLFYAALEFDPEMLNIPLLLIDNGLTLNTPLSNAFNGDISSIIDICIYFDAVKVLEYMFTKFETNISVKSLILGLYLNRNSCVRLLITYAKFADREYVEDDIRQYIMRITEE